MTSTEPPVLIALLVAGFVTVIYVMCQNRRKGDKG